MLIKNEWRLRSSLLPIIRVIWCGWGSNQGATNNTKPLCPNQSQMELELNGRRRDALYANVCVCWLLFFFFRVRSQKKVRTLEEYSGSIEVWKILSCFTCVPWFILEKIEKKRPRKNFRCGRTEKSPHLKGGGKMVKTKRALGWWWNQLRRFDIDLFFNIFLLPFFFFFVSFSTPLLEPDRVLDSWFYRAHGARERVIDQPDYFPAPIIITGCNRLRPPQHRLIFCPFSFFSLPSHVYMGSFRVLLVESPAVASALLFFVS